VKEFYENLKKKRQKQNLTLEAIHERSRLPMAYLRAIEKGEIHKLPKAYEKMYLRRYAREIGLNPDEVIRDFELLRGNLTPPESNAAKQQSEGKKAPVVEPISSAVKETIEEVDLDRVNNYFWPILIAMIFVISGFFVYRYYFAESVTQPPQVREVSIDELLDKANPDTVENAADEAAELSTGESSGQMPGQNNINLALQSLDRVWVRAVCDRIDTTEFILETGFSKSLTAKDSVELVIGRADALSINLNGETLAPLGEANQVARVLLTANGIVRKRLTRVSKQNE
jgi:cytoskeletal protein RodZ